MNSHNLTLSWSPPLSSQRNGVIISYLITCSSGDIIINTTRTSSTSLTITGLQPFTNYTCSVSASTIVGEGPAAAKSIVTKEESKFTGSISERTCQYCKHALIVISLAPGPPTEIMGASTSSSTITLSWSSPAKQNGVITGYSVLCSQSGGILNLSKNFSSSQTTATLSRLLPYTNYSCSITAHTSVGGGPAATINVTTVQDSELIDCNITQNNS